MLSATPKVERQPQPFRRSRNDPGFVRTAGPRSTSGRGTAKRPSRPSSGGRGSVRSTRSTARPQETDKVASCSGSPVYEPQTSNPTPTAPGRIWQRKRDTRQTRGRPPESTVQAFDLPEGVSVSARVCDAVPRQSRIDSRPSPPPVGERSLLSCPRSAQKARYPEFDQRALARACLLMKTISIAAALAVLMCSTSVVGIVARPSAKAADRGQSINLETAVPQAVSAIGSSLKAQPGHAGRQPPDPASCWTRSTAKSSREPTLTGAVIKSSVSLAYGDDQRGGLQAHRPAGLALRHKDEPASQGRRRRPADHQYGTIEVHRTHRTSPRHGNGR